MSKRIEFQYDNFITAVTVYTLYFVGMMLSYIILVGLLKHYIATQWNIYVEIISLIIVLLLGVRFIDYPSHITVKKGAAEFYNDYMILDLAKTCSKIRYSEVEDVKIKRDPWRSPLNGCRVIIQTRTNQWTLHTARKEITYIQTAHYIHLNTFTLMKMIRELRRRIKMIKTDKNKADQT